MFYFFYSEIGRFLLKNLKCLLKLEHERAQGKVTSREKVNTKTTL
jgi:hypothetical protein